MPEAFRDKYADSSRDGAGQQRAADVSMDAPSGVSTLWDEKKLYGDAAVGTRGAADIAAAEAASNG